MKYVKLGNSDLNVSRICTGCTAGWYISLGLGEIVLKVKSNMR